LAAGQDIAINKEGIEVVEQGLGSAHEYEQKTIGVKIDHKLGQIQIGIVKEGILLKFL
jgi:hypothetical protein